uniref:Uncharacterized protein n=1 Tax=Romanomermis culicivorax TaxID=13658 RepID=A0A915J7L5_ROMCU
MMKQTSNNIDQDSMAAKKQKFHDQVENSLSNDNNEKLAIKQKVDNWKNQLKQLNALSKSLLSGFLIFQQTFI